MKISSENSSQILRYTVLGIGALSMLIPFLWMISASFKDNNAVFILPIQWIPKEPTFDNYINVIFQSKIIRNFVNSIKITGITVFFQIITGSMAAYSFTKLKYKGRDTIFFLYLSSMMIPFAVQMIPQFMVVRKMGLVNTHLAVILIGISSPFSVFFFRQFFLSIPNELLQSARVDGAKEFRIYSSIILPISKTAMVSMLVLGFVTSWNEFQVPLIYLNSASKKTLQLGIAQFRDLYMTDFAGMMAYATLSILPVLIIYIKVQKHILDGVALSGIKG